MIEILPIDQEIIDYLQKRGIKNKFFKQLAFLQKNLHHRSLNTELLHPKNRGIYSFRVDRKYRALFIYRKEEIIEVLIVTDHYK